ncbi:MAG: hypothetical protein ACNI28_09095 [Arcobacter sp.]|uniref:hypothetical protein n=1 Tax=Arcobacter sp. TaxID=1872629 RepID=UPI003AFFF617
MKSQILQVVGSGSSISQAVSSAFNTLLLSIQELITILFQISSHSVIVLIQVVIFSDIDSVQVGSLFESFHAGSSLDNSSAFSLALSSISLFIIAIVSASLISLYRVKLSSIFVKSVLFKVGVHRFCQSVTFILSSFIKSAILVSSSSFLVTSTFQSITIISVEEISLLTQKIVPLTAAVESCV